MPKNIFNKTKGLVLSLGLLGLTLSGCTANLLQEGDYKESLRAHAQQQPAEALTKFPPGEAGDFITDLEKAYLKLIQGIPATALLKPHETESDNRVRYDVSRELSSFFYVETPEGYYASEHEIIWLHLLLSWSYSLEKKPTDACVEARLASHYLAAPWSKEGHFDDPLLRIILASLWSLCGSWEDSQVDFRAAWELDKTLTWALQLSKLKKPPKNLILALGGIGPSPYWAPNTQLNPIRGLRNLGFRPQGRKSQLFWMDQNKLIPLQLTPDSKAWYQRHLTRDSELHDLIADTRYGTGTLAHGGMATGKIVTGYLYGGAISLGSIGLGGVLISTGNSSGAQLGVMVGYMGVSYGYKQANLTQESALLVLEVDANPSQSYRFVRFLPEYAWVGWNDAELETTATVILQSAKGTQNQLQLP